MIKVVPGITLKEVLDEHKSVKNYLASLSKSKEIIKIYKENYYKSCGMYYVQISFFFI